MQWKRQRSIKINKKHKSDLLAFTGSTATSVVGVTTGLAYGPIAVIAVPAAQAHFGPVRYTIVVPKGVVSLPAKLGARVAVVIAIAEDSKSGKLSESCLSVLRNGS